MKKVKLLLNVMLIMTLLLSLQINIFAEDSNYSIPSSNVALSPSKEVEKSTGYYMENIKPGDIKTYQFFVTNLSDKEVSVDIYPTDTIPARNGGMNFRNPEDENSIVGNWFQEEKQLITLKAKEKKEFKFTVKVPDNITYGQYIGTVGIREKIEGNTTQAKENEASYKIDTVNKTGIQVVLNYESDKATHKMEITDFKHNYLSNGNLELLVYLNNIGTILEKPTGQITVTNSKDEEIYKKEYKAGSIYESTTAEIPFTPNKIFEAGNYKAKVEATYNNETITRIFDFTVTKKEVDKSIEKLEDSGKIERPTNDNGDTLKMIIIIGSGIIILLIILIFILFFKRKKDKEDKEQK